jgi:hypothetical protein
VARWRAPSSTCTLQRERGRERGKTEQEEKENRKMKKAGPQRSSISRRWNHVLVEMSSVPALFSFGRHASRSVSSDCKMARCCGPDPASVVPRSRRRRASGSPCPPASSKRRIIAQRRTEVAVDDAGGTTPCSVRPSVHHLTLPSRTGRIRYGLNEFGKSAVGIACSVSRPTKARLFFNCVLTWTLPPGQSKYVVISRYISTRTPTW